MKKTLLISCLYPWPESQGTSMRTINFVRFFQQHGIVDIVYSYGAPGKEEEKCNFSNIYHLRRKEYPTDFSKRLVKFVKGEPYPILMYERDSLARLLSLIESSDYDYILARYIKSASGLFNLPQKYRMRTIVDFDDILSGSLYDSYFNNGGGAFKRFIRNMNKKLLIKYEKRCLNFGAALFCSEVDRRKIDRTNKMGNVFVVPNIYENRLFREHNFGDGSQNGNTLLFVGSLGYLPNTEGLRWFIKLIYRRFKRKFHDGKLIVVGHSPTSEIERMCAEEDGVEMHGDVPDVRRYYERCKAVVVPILAGGGTRIKILEAAMAQRPVLSTPLGAEGLDLKNGRDLLFFESSDEFCSGYEELFNRNRYESMVSNAKNVVMRKYSKNAFDEKMKNVTKYLDDSMGRQIEC